MAHFLDDVYLLSIKYSAAAIKSSKTFCWLNLAPAKCHFSPYSLKVKVSKNQQIQNKQLLISAQINSMFEK